MTMLTPAKFEDEMKKLLENRSIEDRHEKADKLMCKALSDNGYEVGVKVFEEMEKWYS